MPDVQIFQNKDLVLKVSPNYDPKHFNLNKYEAFLDALCSDREYQKDGIRETIRYLAGGEYQNLKELAEENFQSNPKLQEKYSSFDDLANYLQLPDQLSCSLDHATGTGKSYVMYGIARILLAAGLVDQVLVLCPSTTIESGLTEKFRILSSERILKDLLPQDSKVLNPRIINASNTIQKGDICIENIHATYTNTKSAIEDSLIGKGDHTLVLNDEAHHLMNPSDRNLKKWKEFLIDPQYGFKYIVNVSGTCYIGDDYFPDVIHRFSLRDAIEAKFIKTIKYVLEDSSGNQDEKFQKIYDNHIEIKTIKYRLVKPITILITKDVKTCERLTDDFIDFLAKKENISEQAAREKVLIVTSHRVHKKNLPTLKFVDSKECPVEWITSVSMLTEGWDVKNVFQIVPHEERAFNSKLLIAQVLGRGLRIPEAYIGQQPVVTVFNHDNWSGSIKHLVDEVLEIEKRVHSYPVTKQEDYNFEIHQIKYNRDEKEVEYPQEEAYDLLRKGYINFSSQFDALERSTIYTQTITGTQTEKLTRIEFKKIPIEVVAHDVYTKLYLWDQDAGTAYSSDFTKSKILEIIKTSLVNSNNPIDWVSEDNRNSVLKAFGVVRRPGSKRLQLTIEAEGLKPISTKHMNADSIGVGALRRDASIFYDDSSFVLSHGEDLLILKELEEDMSLPRSALTHVTNSYDFKTPLNIVLTSFEPERKFVRGLIKNQNAKFIDAWVKSLDMGFYSIEYSWRKGEHPKRGSFNPDFFIKVGNNIIVAEIKMEDDIIDENKAKLRYAKEHFGLLNTMQNTFKYHFKFLSPISYDPFFKSLREESFEGFISDIEAKLRV
jgi:type III restriction enzyme